MIKCEKISGKEKKEESRFERETSRGKKGKRKLTTRKGDVREDLDQYTM